MKPISDDVLDKHLALIIGEPVPHIKKRVKLYRRANRPRHHKKKMRRKKKNKDVKKKAYYYRLTLISRETPAESLTKEILWSLGISFEFQKIIFTRHSFFIVDFYLPKYNIVVEVDGLQHYKNKKQAKYDRSRTRYLEKIRGLKVIRLTNSEVLYNSSKIEAFFQGLIEPLGYDNKSGSNPIVELSAAVKPS